MLSELHDTISTKTKVIVGLVLLGLVFIGLSIRTYTLWYGKQYFGEILSITKEQITIADKKMGTKSLLIDDETVIKKGRASGVGLKEGMSVIVTTFESDDEHANLIRIVEHPNLKKSLPEKTR